MLVLRVDESLMNEEIRVIPSTVEYLEFLSGLHVFHGKALAHPILDIKEGGHLTLGVIGEVPEGDEGKGHPGADPEGDLVLTGHDAGHRPHKVVEVESDLVEGKGGVTVRLK
jgi:hypothetical protein